MTTQLSLLCLLLIIRPEGCCGQWEFSRHLILSYCPANEAWTRSTLTSEFTLGRIWRDENATRGYHYVTCRGRSISMTDNQRIKLSCRGLFVIIQHHHWKTNFKQLEGSNIYLPFISQIPYGVRDRANARRSVSSKRVLFSHVGYGQTGLENEHWRTVTSCIMVLVYGLINTIASRGNNNFRHFEENLKPKDEDEENT